MLKMQSILILAACLLCLLTSFLDGIRMKTPVPSRFYRDMSMPEESISVQDHLIYFCYNSSIEDLKVTYQEPDAQLFMRFEDGKSYNLRCVEFVLAESFEYDVRCEFYYPNAESEYDELLKEYYLLRKGEKEIFFVIPDNIDYPMYRMRLDIDDNYALSEILISETPIVADYSLPSGVNVRPALIAFLGYVFLLEMAFFFRERLKSLVSLCRKNWKKIGICAVCAVLYAALILFGKKLIRGAIGREVSSWWIVTLGFFSVIVLIELFFLVKPVKDRRRKSGAGSLGRNILYWIVILIFCSFLAFLWREGIACDDADVAENAAMVRFIFPVFAVFIETLILAALYQKYILNRRQEDISFRKAYLISIFILCVGYMVIFLPYVSPDETSHYTSAYRVANLLLGKISLLGDKRLLMRQEDYYFYRTARKLLSPEYYKLIMGNTHIVMQRSGMILADCPMVTNAMFAYFSTGVGIAVGRILGLSAELTFYMGRFTNIVFFVIAMNFLMKKIPFGRSALFAIGVMPMTLHMVASYSYDVTIFCLVSFFVTQIMSVICRKERVSDRDFHLCVLFAILMAPSKLVYVPLLFMSLLIPNDRLSDTRTGAYRRKAVIIGAGILSAVFIMLLVNVLGADAALREMIKESSSGNYLASTHTEGYTIGWILSNPIEYLFMCMRTCVKMTDHYLYTMIGSKLGWMDISIPLTYCLISFIVFLLAVNIRDDVSRDIRIGTGAKIWMIILCLGTVFLTFLAITLDFTPMRNNFVHGVQGRYFTPLLPLAVWILRSDMIRVDNGIRKKIILVTGLLNIWILVYLYEYGILAVPG